MHPADVVMPMTNQEFTAKVEGERSSLTGFGEAVVTADLYRRGYGVAKPLDRHRKYSLIADIDTRLVRLQVQVAATGELSVKLGRVSYKDTDLDLPVEVYEPSFEGSEFDYLAIVDRASYSVYYVPSAGIDFKKPRLFVRDADRAKYQGSFV